MGTQAQSKKEILKAKVVNLVKEFIETEGGITLHDLNKVFGEPTGFNNEVAHALAHLSISLK